MLLNAKDILWKGIIEDLFSDFLRFFYADADELFDMKKGFDFLDKELGELYPGVDLHHPMFVDKLVKVHKKDGAEELLLIHIEVQGYRDPLFTHRMFTYFCRILDRFHMEVASIAIFTDNDKSYCPDVYEYNSLDTSTIFRFKTYKIKGQDREALENSDNPFAIVVLTVYVYFDNKEMFINFEREIAALTNKEKPMGITELATQLIKEDGKEEGIEIGMQKTKVSMITNLLLKSNHSLAEIAEFAEVPMDFVIGVQNSLSVAGK